MRACASQKRRDMMKTPDHVIYRYFNEILEIFSSFSFILFSKFLQLG
jgi:hypothetical protein